MSNIIFANKDLGIRCWGENLPAQRVEKQPAGFPFWSETESGKSCGKESVQSKFILWNSQELIESKKKIKKWVSLQRKWNPTKDCVESLYKKAGQLLLSAMRFCYVCPSLWVLANYAEVSFSRCSCLVDLCSGKQAFSCAPKSNYQLHDHLHHLYLRLYLYIYLFVCLCTCSNIAQI